MGQEFKKKSKDALEVLILRTRFSDHVSKFKEMIRRKEEWIKDLNLNLVKGKVIKSTHYFDELSLERKRILIEALNTDPG